MKCIFSIIDLEKMHLLPKFEVWTFTKKPKIPAVSPSITSGGCHIPTYSLFGAEFQKIHIYQIND